MVNFKNDTLIKALAFSSDGFSLKGYLHLPAVDQPPIVIGSHGLFSDKNSPKQIELATQCNRNHIAYYRFDYRGCGESSAPFETLTSLAARCKDLIAAANMLKARNDVGDQMGLFGSSMGGTVSLAIARAIKVNAVVTWAAPICSIDIVSGRTNRQPIENSNISFKKNPFDISDQLPGLHNILVCHGDADETVPLSHAREIYTRVNEPKKLVILPQSDHRMSNPANQQVFIQEAASWFQTYL